MKVKEEYHFFTHYTYVDCTNILTMNIKSNWLEGDFLGEMKDDEFSIRYSNYCRFGARYNHPTFYGKLKRDESGTNIDGYFDRSTNFNFFEYLMMIFFFIASLFFLLSFITNIFSDPHNPEYQNPIIMLIGFIIFSILGQGVPRMIKGFRVDDKRQILDFIKSKLNITDDSIN